MNELVYEAKKGEHVTVAAANALHYFDAERKVRWAKTPFEAAPEEVFRFNDVGVPVKASDSAASLAERWFDLHREAAEHRRRVLDANPELEELMPKLGLMTHLSMGNTLDWIAGFAAIADDSVVELFADEVTQRFTSLGYKAQEPLTFGAMMKQREEIQKSREAYGRHIVELFLHELAKGREIIRDFSAAPEHYDSMPYAQA
jgi:hypothetical protein